MLQKQYSNVIVVKEFFFPLTYFLKVMEENSFRFVIKILKKSE